MEWLGAVPAVPQPMNISPRTAIAANFTNGIFGT